MKNIRIALLCFVWILMLASCSTSKIRNSKVKPTDVTDLQYLEPISYIALIEEGNKKKYDDSISYISKFLMTRVVAKFNKQIPVTGHLIADNTLERKTYYDEVGYMLNAIKKNKKISKLPDVINAQLEAKGKRFGLITVTTGFTRTRQNMLERYAIGFGIAIMTGGMASTTPIKASTTLHVMIVDAQKNNIAFYRRVTAQNTEPTDGSNMVLLFRKAFKRYFALPLYDQGPRNNCQLPMLTISNKLIPKEGLTIVFKRTDSPAKEYNDGRIALEYGFYVIEKNKERPMLFENQKTTITALKGIKLPKANFLITFNKNQLGVDPELLNLRFEVIPSNSKMQISTYDIFKLLTNNTDFRKSENQIFVYFSPKSKKGSGAFEIAIGKLPPVSNDVLCFMELFGSSVNQPTIEIPNLQQEQISSQKSSKPTSTYTALEIPEKYVRPNENTDILPATAVVRGRAWVVYSDRHNNATYTTPEGTTQKSVLNYLEAVYPVEEKGEYLHVVKGKFMGGSHKIDISEDYGWISKQHLLLWSNSLLTKNNNLKKALPFEMHRQDDEIPDVNAGSSEVNLYQSPYLTEKTANMNSPFFFVYKQEGDALLLGISDRCDPTYIKDNIVGWADASKLLIYNNRIALEPNWNEDAAQERQTKRVKAKVFTDPQSAEKFMRGEPVPDNKVIWQDDRYAGRMVGDMMRFLVTGMVKNNIYEVYLQTNSYQTTHNHDCLVGYAVLEREDMQHPLFNKVLFLTRVELGQMLTKMEALYNASTSSDRRQQMQKTWLELLRKYTDGNRSDYDQMTMEQINKMVFGLPGAESSVLRGIKLRDITDKAVISDVAFEEYAEAVQSKYNRLFRAYNQDKWLYSFRSNDVTYYWISEDMLP